MHDVYDRHRDHHGDRVTGTMFMVTIRVCVSLSSCSIELVV